MTTAELVKQGFGGYQGWGDAEANADFNATGGSGKKTGGGGGDISVPSIAGYTEQAYAPADEALKSYVMAMRGQQKPLDIYKSLETEAGLPEMKKVAGTLREQIGGLEDTIRRIEGDVAATTRESLVTEGQRSGMIQARQRPLLQNLGTLTTGLGRIEQGISAASQGIDTKTGLFIKGQEQELKPYEIQVSALQDKAARMVSGFTADAENQLQVSMAKWQRQNQLDDREVEQAFQIMMAEKGYNNELAKMKEQSGINISEYQKKSDIDTAAKAKQAVSSGSGVKNYYSTPAKGTSYYGGTSISSLWG